MDRPCALYCCATGGHNPNFIVGELGPSMPVNGRHTNLGPPLAVVRRRIVPPAKPYEEMTTDEILADATSRLWHIAEMQVADAERRFGMADRVQKAPKSLGDAGRRRPRT